jgi:hypothetical protein
MMIGLGKPTEIPEVNGILPEHFEPACDEEFPSV